MAKSEQNPENKEKKETFQGVFVRYASKKNNVHRQIPGLYLKAICKSRSKKIIIDEQWSAIGKDFKEIVDSYTEEELQGKSIQFNATQEAHPKGYFEYRDNVLISVPEDLEYRLLGLSNVKVL